MAPFAHASLLCLVHHVQRRGAHARNDRSAFSRLSTGGTSGIASQFNRNAMSCVSVRIDESPRRCEVRNSAPATGHWKCFFSTTDEHRVTRLVDRAIAGASTAETVPSIRRVTP